jgi:sarcosine oxidase subunit alpha
MPREVTFFVSGRPVKGKEGDSLLAAMMNAGFLEFRHEETHAHAPICGMGICFECLVQVKGRGSLRACMVAVEEGMEVEF